MAHNRVKTIGILRADFGGKELISKHGLYHDMFVDLFRKVDPELEFKIYDIPQGVKPTKADECDAYIITGSRAGVYENDVFPWINELLVILLNISQQSIPQAGICFGHQALALAFGGKVAKSEKGWVVGVNSYQATNAVCSTYTGADESEIASAAMSNELPNKFSIIAIHQDQVIAKPPDAEVIATSDFCPIAALRSTRNNFISFQGHPEFSAGLLLEIMDRRADSIGAEKVEEARRSLEHPIQATEIAQTILHFFSKQIASQAEQRVVA